MARVLFVACLFCVAASACGDFKELMKPATPGHPHVHKYSLAVAQLVLQFAKQSEVDFTTTSSGLIGALHTVNALVGSAHAFGALAS